MPRQPASPSTLAAGPPVPWLRRAAPVLGLLALVFVAYAPAYRAGFIWDDDDYLTENEALRSAAGLGRIWFEPGALTQYYPLYYTTFWIEYRLWGLHPTGYHVVNILLHAANAVLVWRVLRRLRLPGAWLVAALFAVHPMNVESVAWITERRNVLSGFFFLLALLLYLRFEPPGAAQPAARDWTAYGAALLAFAAALLSKTVTCSLPAVLFLLLWWRSGRVRWRDVLPLIPFLALGLLLTGITYWLESRYVPGTARDWALTPAQRIVLAGQVAWFYAIKLAWPVPLIHVYPRWPVSAASAAQWLPVLATVAVLGGLWLLRRQVGRGALVALLAFGGMLVPTLGLLDFGYMDYAWVADRFVYLPGIALFALLVGAGAYWSARASPGAVRGAAAVAAILVLACAVATFARSTVFRDGERLWRDVLRHDPQSYPAHNMLGTHLAESGQLPEAIQHLRTALQLRPDDAFARNNLANALQSSGRMGEALSEYLELLRRDPDDKYAHNNLGGLYAALGRFDDAIAHLERALALDPTLENTRRMLNEVRAARARQVRPPGQ